MKTKMKTCLTCEDWEQMPIELDKGVCPVCGLEADDYD